MASRIKHPRPALREDWTASARRLIIGCGDGRHCRQGVRLTLETGVCTPEMDATRALGLHRLFAVFVIAVNVFQISTPAGAQDNARAIMEKRGLLGIWSASCRAAASPQNTYTVYRALDQQRVQWDVMTSPTQRSEAGVIESMVEVGSDLIYTQTGPTSDEIKMHVDGYRARIIELARNGTKLIADGKHLAAYGNAAFTGKETPWVTKCDSPAGQAQERAAVATPPPGNSQPSVASLSAPRESIPNLQGTYSVAGVNPNGSRYRGAVTIKTDGDLYYFQWRISSGQTYRGKGTLNERTLTVDWGSDSPVIYQLKNDGTLTGTWANGSARERLTPR